MKKDIFVDNKTTAFYHEAMLDRRKIVNKFLQTEHIVVYPGDCLELLKFADELIVVDDESTDRTVELARKFTNKVFIKKLRY